MRAVTLLLLASLTVPAIAADAEDRALLRAAKSGHAELAAFAITEGADVDARDASAEGITALMHAVAGAHTDVVGILLRHRADVNLVTTGNRTALLMAAEQGHVELVATLLAAGARTDVREDRHGFAPLHPAAQGGFPRTVTVLLRNGANPDIATHDGRTPLMLAARGNHPGLVNTLLKRGAAVDAAVADSGTTALRLAMDRGLVETTGLLLEAGSNARHRDNQGRNALTAAELLGDAELLSLLRRAAP